MDFLSQHIIEPNATHLRLLEFLAVVVYTIHLPYIAMLIGSSSVAMWLTFSDHEIPNPRFARLAEDLLGITHHRIPMLVLGVLPLFVLPFIYGQWFVGAPEFPFRYLVYPIPGVVAGILVLALYRRTFRERAGRFHFHMLLGTLGLGLLVASYFVLMSGVIRLQDPEKWFRLKNVVIMVLNWNVIWRFLLFTHMGFGLTGAAILFFVLRWRGADSVKDAEYAAFARRFGAGLGLAFCFAVPVFNLFYVFTSPDIVFDNTVYLLGAAVTLVTMVIAYVFLSVLRASGPRYGATAFSLFMVVFVLSSTFDVRSMANANREHARIIETRAAREQLEREATIEAAQAAMEGRDLGEETFQNVCMQCHRLDTKLVGPPLYSVLPKYAGNAEHLETFVLNPVKVNPDYPPMPNPGLTSAQAKAVAKYLLGQLDQHQGTDASQSGTQTPTQTEVQSGQTNH